MYEKDVKMRGFDVIKDDLEIWVQKQGFTLGQDAERLKRIPYMLKYFRMHCIITEEEEKVMAKRFWKQFYQCLRKLPARPKQPVGNNV